MEKSELNFWPTDVILALTSRTLPESLLSYQEEWEGCDMGPLDTDREGLGEAGRSVQSPGEARSPSPLESKLHKARPWNRGTEVGVLPEGVCPGGS